MSTESKKEIQLEIAHVLFIDIVGYSKLSINEQRTAVDELTQIVRSTEQFQKADAADRLIKIATGDGMALVFYTSPEAPVRCAMELSRALKDHPRLRLQMGIHSGPVSGVVDVASKANVTGAGLNMAHRVMNCGDAGHILLSKHVTEDLEEYDEWRPLLHQLGMCEVKHGLQLGVVSLFSEDVGNAQLPKTFQALRKKRAHARWTRSTPVGSIREQAGYSCAESVCSLFEKTMRINNRLSGFSSPQTIEQFHQARLVGITHWRFAICLDPFRVLNPEVVVNLLPELHVGMDLMMQGCWLGGRFMCGAGRFA
jgi:adenylate/guanylate cyclase family protein